MESTAIERPVRGDRPGWGDRHSWTGADDDGVPGEGGRGAFQPLTRQEAQALRLAQPPLSPWRVVRWQAAVGMGVALLLALLTRRLALGLSALYGAATVVVPGVLIARGMTSRLSSMSPGASAVSFMLWASVKIAVSVALLVLAPRLVQPLSWPALLAGLVLCMNVYWLALLWRPGRKQTN
ncbi:MAG: ATP synthase subunit I [Burkholderiales bacterium]|nr:ATP synthase subunit I [Burkholderiales bacterium]